MTVAISFCIRIVGLPMLSVWPQRFTCPVRDLVAFRCSNNPAHQNLCHLQRLAGVNFYDYDYHYIWRPLSIHHHNLRQQGDFCQG